MNSTIEDRINFLKGKPYTQEIGNHARSYGDWIVANYAHVIERNKLSDDWNCLPHLEELGELRGMSQNQVIQTLEKLHGEYQDIRAMRAMDDILQEEQAMVFSNYAVECREYLEHLTEAMDDHLGKSPETVERKDLDAIYEITKSVREAYDNTADYGYTHRPEDAEVRWYVQ